MLAVYLVAIPVVSSILVWFTRASRWATCGVAVAAVLFQACLVFVLPSQVQAAELALPVEWSSLSRTMLITMYLGTAVQFVYASQVSQGHSFHSLALLFDAVVSASLLQANQMPLAGLLIVLALSLTVYGAGHRALRSGEIDAALKMLITAAIAAVVFTLVMLLIDAYETTHDPASIRIVAAVLSIGAGILLTVFPFHLWLPKLADFAPPMVVVWLVSYIEAAVVVVLICSVRVYPWLHSSERVAELLSWTGVATAIVAGVLALGSNRPTRLVVYSAISNIGVMVVGLASNSAGGLTGAALLALTQIAAVLLLLMCIGLQPIGSLKIGLAGAGGPGTVIFGLLVGGLSIAGVPPFAGFPGRWLVYSTVMTKEPTAVVGLAVASSLVVMAFLRALLSNTEAVESGFPKPPPLVLAAVISVVLVLVAIGVYPSPLTTFIIDTVQGFSGIE